MLRKEKNTFGDKIEAAVNRYGGNDNGVTGGGMAISDYTGNHTKGQLCVRELECPKAFLMILKETLSLFFLCINVFTLIFILQGRYG